MVVVIGLVTTLSLQGSRNTADAAGTAKQIVSLLRQAQSGAMAQKNESAWGVHFENPSSSAPFFALFKGNSYASGTVQAQYRLSPNLAFQTSTVAANSYKDVVFSPVSGGTSQTDHIGTYVVSQPSIVATITVENTGRAAYSLSSDTASSSSTNSSSNIVPIGGGDNCPFYADCAAPPPDCVYIPDPNDPCVCGTLSCGGPNGPVGN